MVTRRHANGINGHGTSTVRIDGLARLAQSGLVDGDARSLGITYHDAAEVARMCDTFKPLPAMRIPYWRADDMAKPLAPWPSLPQFYRLRYLGRLDASFADNTRKPPRYAQPSGTGVCAYFPRVGGIDWPTVMRSPTMPLIVTEGELKAAASCKISFPAIGLGGVWNWR